MYDRLATFAELYRARSMHSAAAALGLTQPAVSQQIAGLEAELGVRLFQRTSRGVIPTPAADQLMQEVSGPLDHLSASVAARKARSASLDGLVVLGAPVEFFTALGSQLLADLARPSLQLDVRLGGRKLLHSGLVDGDFDIAFLASPPPDDRFAAQAVLTERLLLVGSPRLKSQLGRAVTADALKALPMAAYDADLALIQEVWTARFGASVSHRPGLVVPNLLALRQICARHGYWTVLPDYLITGRNDLVELDADPPVVENTIYLVWRRTALRTPRLASVRDALLTAMQAR